MNKNASPSVTFDQAKNGLYLPKGHEDVVNPTESVLNGAMHVGMTEDDRGLASVRTERGDVNNEILKLQNIIDLKEEIDYRVNKRNAEESHLGDTIDGSKQAREAENRRAISAEVMDKYLHTGDPSNRRDVPEEVRKDLEYFLGKDYEELEEMIASQSKKPEEAKQQPQESLLTDFDKTVLKMAYDVAKSWSKNSGIDATKASDEAAYLEALDYIKQQFQTDDDSDLRVRATIANLDGNAQKIARMLAANPDITVEDIYARATPNTRADVVGSDETSSKSSSSSTSSSSTSASERTPRTDDGQSTHEAPTDVQPRVLALEQATQAQLDKARNELIEVLVKDRRKHWGTYLNEDTRIGRWLRKPSNEDSLRFKLATALFKVNEKFDTNGTSEKLDAYEAALKTAGNEAAKLFAEAGLEDNQIINELTLQALSAEAAAIEANVNHGEKAEASNSRFANFWLKNKKGAAGWIKRYGAVGGIGAGIGFAGAIATLPATVTAAAAFGVGAGAARLISRNKSKSVVGKNKADKDILYGDKAEYENIEADKVFIGNSLAENGTVSAEDFTNRIEDRRNEVIKKNRETSRRIRSAVMLGAAAGNALGNFVRGDLHLPGQGSKKSSGTDSGSSSSSSSSTSSTPNSIPDAKPATPINRLAEGIKEARRIHGITPDQYGSAADKRVIRDTLRLANYLRNK